MIPMAAISMFSVSEIEWSVVQPHAGRGGPPEGSRVEVNVPSGDTVALLELASDAHARPRRRLSAAWLS
jgi:hypothetical protein